MLTPDELEVALLGSQWVARCGDKALMKNAASLVEKIQATLPTHLQQVMGSSSVVLSDSQEAVADNLDMSELRTAMHDRKKVSILYQTGGQQSERTIWPILIGYFERVRVVAAINSSQVLKWSAN